MVGAATEDIITPSIKELQDRINHLEEENARLRNSIQQCANHQHDINSFGVCQQNNEHNGEDDHATNETIPRSSSQDTSSIVSVKDMKDSKKNAADDDVDHDSRHASPSSSSSLTRDQVERYSRQLLLQDGFGVKGQLQLLSSSVLVVGAGGIGSTGKEKEETSSKLCCFRYSLLFFATLWNCISFGILSNSQQTLALCYQSVRLQLSCIWRHVVSVN